MEHTFLLQVKMIFHIDGHWGSTIVGMEWAILGGKGIPPMLPGGV